MFRRALAAAVAAAFSALAVGQDGPVTETVLYSFTGFGGMYPGRGALTLGKDGNLYGVTEQGGANQKGAIDRLAPDGAPTLL